METYYQTEYSKLYNADCLTIIKNLKFDKVITSPPYNIVRPNSSDRGYDLYKDGMSNEEYSNWIVTIFEEFDKAMNPNGCVLWNMSYGSENTECMSLTVSDILKKTNFTLADILVWKKNSATPNNVSSNKMTRICEYIYVFVRRSEFMTFTTNKKIIGKRDDTGQIIYENVFNFFQAINNDECQNLNKATFSEDFVFNLIDRYVLPTDKVLDCFSGTGTTMVACEKKQIHSIGIELSEAQCKHTVDRMKKGIQLALI